jgi:glycosyltransferase involved in cell wall biosynthesis
MVVHGETGLLVEPENVDDLAAAIKSLLKDPELAQRMGVAGRQRTLDHFLWDKIVAKMLEDLSQVV